MSESRPDLGRAAVRGLRWSVVVRPLVEVVLLGSMVVLARLIPPAEFGHLAVALIVGELAIGIPNEGVGSALVQRKNLTRAHVQTGFAMTLMVGAFLAALTLVLAEVAIEPIFAERTAELVKLTIPVFFVTAFATVPSALLRRRLAFRTMLGIEIAATFVRASASVGLALAGLDAEALVFGGLISAMVVATIVWIAAPSPPPWLHVARARELLQFGLPAAFASISWVGFRNCDYAIVGARLGATQAGYYFRAYSLAVEYQKKISSVMGMLAFPVLSRAASHEEMVRLRTHMVRSITIVLFPILVGLVILAPAVVPWVFGPAWAPAIVPTQILAIGGAATLVSDCAGASLMAQGRTRAILGFGWAHFFVYAAGVMLLAPLGLAVVAMVAASVHGLFLGVAYWLMLRGTGESVLPRLWHDVGPATVSCLGFAAAAIPAYMALTAAGAAVPTLLVAVGGLGGAVYCVTLRLLFPDAWSFTVALIRRVVPLHRLRRPGRRSSVSADAPVKA